MAPNEWSRTALDVAIVALAILAASYVAGAVCYWLFGPRRNR
jgi:hypothetical protein